MRTHFVIHEAFEAPGVFETWAVARGHEISYSRLHASERLPATVDGIDLLIVMGGPQQPTTSTGECPYFDATAEKNLIAACVQANKAVIGVCLGAQMIGAALGAASEPSPEPEIGCFPITLSGEGRQDSYFAGFPGTFDTGHWHNDMPGLTAGSAVLAASAGCPRQIIAYGRFVYGFQCHMEFTPALIDALIGHSGPSLAALAGRRFVQQPAELRRTDYDAVNKHLALFLDRLDADYSAALTQQPAH